MCAPGTEVVLGHLVRELYGVAGGERKGGAGAEWPVMHRHGLHHGPGEAPEAEEIGSGPAVSGRVPGVAPPES